MYIQIFEEKTKYKKCNKNLITFLISNLEEFIYIIVDKIV